MKKIFLTTSLIMSIFAMHAQTTTPTDREQNNSTRPERTSLNDITKTREQQETKTTVYYIAFTVTKAASERNIKFELEQGSTPEAPRNFGADLAAIKRLASGRLIATHELDLINYLSSMGWEMVSLMDIATPKEAAIRQSKIYFKKSYNE